MRLAPLASIASVALAASDEPIFEIAGAASTTSDTSPNGMYYRGQPRAPNCEQFGGTPPCTTYYKVGDPAYMVDSGDTIGA